MRAAALALTGLLLASLAPAQAEVKQTQGSGIAVESCNPHRHVSGQRHAWIDPYGTLRDATVFRIEDGFLGIDYRNEAKVPATEVDFGLVARGALIATARDLGTFSPGVTIRHEFVISQEVFPIGTDFPYCAVLHVKYADGTSWRNPNPPPE